MSDKNLSVTKGEIPVIAVKIIDNNAPLSLAFEKNIQYILEEHNNHSSSHPYLLNELNTLSSNLETNQSFMEQTITYVNNLVQDYSQAVNLNKQHIMENTEAIDEIYQVADAVTEIPADHVLSKDSTCHYVYKELLNTGLSNADLNLDFITASYTNSSTGSYYKQFRSGFTIQGGAVDYIQAVNTAKAVNFIKPVAYPLTQRFSLITISNSASFQASLSYPLSISKTAFNICCNSSPTRIYWIAMGY